MSQQSVNLSQMLMWSTITFVSPEVRYGPGFSLPLHRHPDAWQADWVLEGRLSYIIDGEEIQIAPGEIGFIPPTIHHRLVSQYGSVLRSLKFIVPFEFPRGRTFVVRLEEQSPLLELLAMEVFTPRSTLPWPMTAGYLGALLRLVETSAPDEPNSGVRAIDNPIARAKQFALEHLGEPLTVTHMANAAHLSVSHFSRLFRAAHGMTPIDWLTEKRLLQATRLLRYADITLPDIASTVGYADLPSFSRSFKRRFGLTPSAYRSKAGDRQMSELWNVTQF